MTHHSMNPDTVPPTGLIPSQYGIVIWMIEEKCGQARTLV